MNTEKTTQVFSIFMLSISKNPICHVSALTPQGWFQWLPEPLTPPDVESDHRDQQYVNSTKSVCMCGDWR